MVNHARDLFLNLAGLPATPYTYPGEEYIPPAFNPLRLPAWMQILRSAIFGVRPDRAMMNLRAQELILPLHDTDLADYVTALDPRITYVPGNLLFDRLAAGPTYAAVNDATKRVFFVGNLDQLFKSERIFRQHHVTVTDGSTLAIQYFDDAANTQVIDVAPYTVSSGLSSLVQLPDIAVQFRFDPGVGTIWNFETLARPIDNLTAVENRMASVINSGVEAELFGNDREPYSTFRNLWESHPFPIYRLGGAMLALIYRMDALRG